MTAVFYASLSPILSGENMKTGFTLIEVLVVVLIIGILTSIALPQYQKVVEKARMKEGLELAAVLRDAQVVFYDTYGHYASDAEIDALDVSIPFSGKKDDWGRPTTKYFSVTLSVRSLDGTPNLFAVQRLPVGQKYGISIKENNDLKISCKAFDTATTYEKKLCAQIDEFGHF